MWQPQFFSNWYLDSSTINYDTVYMYLNVNLLH